MFKKIILRGFITILLTIITQVGGIIYLISLFLTRKHSKLKLIVFISLYLFNNILIIPNIAPFFGREQITESEFVEAHSIFYKLCHRNYVRPKLDKAITSIGVQLFEKKGIKLIYLDANFPFINKFPLLPHLSHNDGKKVDVSLIYTENNNYTDKKPSVSGYGVFEDARKIDVDYSKICKKRGKWQYDLTKYISFGTINKNINFSSKGNRALVNLIVSHKSVGKLFIEPHLKKRLGLQNSKVCFHGCHAVRHDDHIHFQLR